MCVIMALSAVVCLAVWMPVKNTVGIVIFICVFGFSSGAFISLSPALIAQISHVHEIGTKIGTAYTLMSFGALIGSPLGGAIMTAQHGQFWGLQLFCGFCLLAAACILVAARYVLVGFRLSVV
jgi:MFS family permease